MPMVFVHGVATRRAQADPEPYERAVRQRDALFRRYVFPGLLDPSRAVRSPYWGGHGADPAWGYASLPDSTAEAFGTDADPVVGLLDDAVGQVPDGDEPLLAVARRDGLPVVVDVVGALAIDEAVGEAPGADGDPAGVDDTTAATARLLAHAERDPRPAWLDEVGSDVELLQRLVDEAAASEPGPSDEEVFGGGGRFWDRLREGADRVRDAVPRVVTRTVLQATRRNLQVRATGFFGDVFVYLRRAERGEAIRAAVAGDLRAAAAERTATEPLVVVAHSMGGNICYDLLTSECRDVEVDAFVTVGSQVGFFEELKLFSASDGAVRPGGSQERVRPTPNIRSWLNVFDLNDPLAFAVEPVFEPPAQDYSYSTGEQTLAAHSAYWMRPSFHERFARRLRPVLTARGGTP